MAASAEIALVLYGDTPLLGAALLARLIETLEPSQAPLALLTCRLPDPTGYGRILRNGAGAVVGVREHRDASAEERASDEINPGVYAARVPFLRQALADVRPENDQRELYLTDVVSLAAARGGVADLAADAGSLAGINDRAQLARAEEAMYERIADAWRLQGVTVRAGARVDALVELGPDAVIEPGAVLRGRTRIGARAHVDVGAVLTDVAVEGEALVKPYVVAQDAIIGARAQVGPFAQLRAGTVIEQDARIGNFVETKKTRLGRGAKANHLAYLGDGDIGEGANVGAGTIFCNYDGVLKHRTVIGARAFIGSDSQLVAPVTVGAGAYVGTGTTVTLDVPADALAIGRAKQVNKEGYAPRLRAKLEARRKRG